MKILVNARRFGIVVFETLSVCSLLCHRSLFSMLSLSISLSHSPHVPFQEERIRRKREAFLKQMQDKEKLADARKKVHFSSLLRTG